MTRTLNKIVPTQKTGSHTGATARKSMATRHDALVLFEEAKKRLLDVNRWQKISGGDGAEFRLTDESGQVLENKLAQKGNLVRIKLPAPPNKKGEGYDWVRIEDFEYNKDLLKDEEMFGFRVRPVQMPGQEQEESAHFYTSDATSTFIVMRKGCIVSAMERGRNERPNVAGSILNKMRNALVAIGAMLGLAKPQWKKLTESILEPAKN